MNHDTRIALFLMGELVAALRANDSDLFKRWLYGGIEDLGESALTPHGSKGVLLERQTLCSLGLMHPFGSIH